MILPCGLSQPYDPPHFLETYLVAAGETKPPPELHVWCGLSLLAAASQDRIWFDKVYDKPLYPNLYTILIGSSGTGKGTAIEHARSVAHGCDAESREYMAELHGKATPQALISSMSKAQHVQYIWLITPELAMSIGTGPKADDFVRHFTGLYEGLGDLNDWTRQYGEKRIEGNVCINWLAASTMQWLVGSIPRATIESGFFGRCCPVPVKRKLAVPVDPIYPQNKRQLMHWLSTYVAALTRDTGQVIRSKDGQEAMYEWFHRRKQPELEFLEPFWERQDDLVTKISMLLARGDDYRMVIDSRHVLDAIALTDWVYARIPPLVEHAYRTEVGASFQFVTDWFADRPRRWLSRSTVVRATSRRNIMKPQLDAILLTLVERQDLYVSTNPKDDLTNVQFTNEVNKRGAYYWWDAVESG